MTTVICVIALVVFVYWFVHIFIEDEPDMEE